MGAQPPLPEGVSVPGVSVKKEGVKCLINVV